MKKKFAPLYLFIVALLLLPVPGSAAEPGNEMASAPVECTTNKAKTPTCRKKSGSNAPVVKAKRKQCVFRCTKERDGIWVCRGNGPQCNGQSPWD